jgi:flagellar biosynthesis/type III secretory pathway protein FliH
LASATKQTLSLNDPDPKTGFQSVVIGKSTENRGDSFVPQGSTTATTEITKPQFGFPSNFWEMISSDVQLKNQISEMIEKRAEERALEINRLTRAEIEAKGFAEGHVRGVAQGFSEVEAALNRINGIAEQILREKETVLHDHEKQWNRAFSHLLKRFMVPQPGKIAAEIQRWLTESLENFPNQHKVCVNLSSEDFAVVTKLAGDLALSFPGKAWELVEDSTLAPGEVHCETDVGGLFFSPSREAEKLDGLIEHFNREKGNRFVDEAKAK